MRKEIKVLYIIDGLRSGGKERQLLETLKAIDKSCFKTGVITFNSGQHYSTKVKDICQYYKELKKKPFRFAPFFKIQRYFQEFNPDIVHTMDSLSSFYSYFPCRWLGIPFIDGSIRDAGVDKGLNRRLKRYFLKRADLIISNSNAGLEAYNVSGQVIYNIIDTARFIGPALKDSFNIIMAANFTDYKDHFTFIKASAGLIQKNLVDKVYLLGDGPYKNKYQEMVNNIYPQIREHFNFTGAVENVEEYLKKCSVGVLCSTRHFSEGLSNSVLEYMASGLVSIVTNIGGNKEIINNGVNGFLIDECDDLAIVKIISVIRQNKIISKEISANAIETIVAKFEKSINIRLLQNAYINLLDGLNKTQITAA